MLRPSTVKPAGPAAKKIPTADSNVVLTGLKQKAELKFQPKTPD